MRRFRKLLAYAAVGMLLGSPAARAQEAQAQTQESKTERQERERFGFLRGFAQRYRAQDIGPINLRNSGRLESLLRAGQLYLSLQDVIALALENNLDIELQRYGPQLARANLLRSEAGGLLRGVTTSVQQGPTSATNLVTGGAGTGGGGNGSGSAQTALQGAGGTIITQTGVAIPQLDETLFFNYGWNRRNTPNSNSLITGVSTTNINSGDYNFGLQKGFITGTSVVVGYSNTRLSTNSPNSDINPSISSNLNFQVTQRLLQGFGIALNNRNIRIARNNLKVSDLTFKQQVINTVSSVINLYADLVVFNEDVRVRRQALALAEKLFEDNKKQVEIGTLAPIEVVRAEAEVATRQQELLTAETQVLQQETILKNALSRTGLASASIADARIVPTDPLQVPVAQEPVVPIQDVVALALENRPELQQTRINIENAQIGILGSRSQLLPSLDLVLSGQSNALAGSVSTIELPDITGTGNLRQRQPNPALLGGYSTVLGQIFGFNYPNYTLGFQLNVPIRNRTAQADLIVDQTNLRQAEIRQQ